MTYNKSQSQTVEKAALDVRDPIFAHGQLYTGASRVRDARDLAWIVDSSTIFQATPIADENIDDMFPRQALTNMDLEGTPHPYIGQPRVDNIVYKEAIDNCL
jgi:ATP-dependent exoDNAse (exonuclease V) alpha subunit